MSTPILQCLSPHSQTFRIKPKQIWSFLMAHTSPFNLSPSLSPSPGWGTETLSSIRPALTYTGWKGWLGAQWRIKTLVCLYHQRKKSAWIIRHTSKVSFIRPVWEFETFICGHFVFVLVSLWIPSGRMHRSFKTQNVFDRRPYPGLVWRNLKLCEPVFNFTVSNFYHNPLNYRLRSCAALRVM